MSGDYVVKTREEATICTPALSNTHTHTQSLAVITELPIRGEGDVVNESYRSFPNSSSDAYSEETIELFI